MRRQDTTAARTPTIQVLILIIDKPLNPKKIGSTLDANAIEDQSTTNKPTVEILNAYASDYFYKTEEREKFDGRYRWRWTDSVSRKIQRDGSYEIEDGIVFDFASYDAKKPSMLMLDWKKITDVNNVVTKNSLRHRIDCMINPFNDDFDAFNNDPNNNNTEFTSRLELLGTKHIDETADIKFALVRNSQWSGDHVCTPVWTQRCWWEIKEIHVDGPVGQAKSKSCCPPLLLDELGQDQRPEANDDNLEGEANGAV